MALKLNFNKSANADLNASSTYRDEACVHCGKKFPDTILNIEGHIHHGEPYRCYDTKACNKSKKKNK